MIQNIQVHMMSYRCRLRQHILSANKNYTDELFKTKCISTQKQKKTFMKTRGYQSKLVNTIKKKKKKFHKYYGK